MQILKTSVSLSIFFTTSQTLVLSFLDKNFFWKKNMDWKETPFESFSLVITTIFDIRFFEKHVSDKKSKWLVIEIIL